MRYVALAKGDGSEGVATIFGSTVRLDGDGGLFWSEGGVYDGDVRDIGVDLVVRNGGCGEATCDRDISESQSK